MTLPASGAISLNNVNVELGLSGTASINMGSAAVRGLFGVASGAISMSDGYGKSNEFILTSAGLVNGEKQRQQISVSSFISSGDTMRIPSDIWVWSDNTGIAALTIDIPCTIINEGKIIGKGGDGVGRSAGLPGGRAINITSSGVTFTNASGAYIGGGGGAAGSSRNEHYSGGGGGGAGGGAGGNSINSAATGGGGAAGGAGGALNAAGATAAGQYPKAAGGGGGGRILPGVGGLPGSGQRSPGQGGGAGGGGWTWDSNSVAETGGAGGSAGAAGNVNGNSITNQFAHVGAAGGGGWGAAGSISISYFGFGNANGGAGGAAIVPNGNAYTLSNSGTIYGST
jgi:hypothetical protein